MSSMRRGFALVAAATLGGASGSSTPDYTAAATRAVELAAQVVHAQAGALGRKSQRHRPLDPRLAPVIIATFPSSLAMIF